MITAFLIALLLAAVATLILVVRIVRMLKGTNHMIASLWDQPPQGEAEWSTGPNSSDDG